MPSFRSRAELCFRAATVVAQLQGLFRNTHTYMQENNIATTQTNRNYKPSALVGFSKSAAFVRMHKVTNDAGVSRELVLVVCSVAVGLRTEEGDKAFLVGAGVNPHEKYGYSVVEIKRGYQQRIYLGMPDSINGTPVDFRKYIEDYSPEGEWKLLKMEKSGLTGAPTTISYSLDANLRPVESSLSHPEGMGFDQVSYNAASSDSEMSKAYNALVTAWRLLGGATRVPALIEGELQMQTWRDAVAKEEEFRSRFQPRQNSNRGGHRRQYQPPAARVVDQLDPNMLAALDSVAQPA